MGGVREWERQGNVHAPLGGDLKARPFHRRVAQLAAERLPPEGALLDLGCGAGLGLREVAKLRPDARLAAADAYQVCLDAAEERAPGLAARYLLDESAFAPDKAIPDRFDMVVMSHVLEHLINPADAVQSALRLLRPGGRLILATPNPARPDLMISNLFRYDYVNRGHVCAWDPAHWRNFLGRVLALDVEVYAADAVSFGPSAPARFLTDLVGPALARVAPWWAFSNIAVIRAPE